MAWHSSGTLLAQCASSSTARRAGRKHGAVRMISVELAGKTSNYRHSRAFAEREPRHRWAVAHVPTPCATDLPRTRMPALLSALFRFRQPRTSSFLSRRTCCRGWQLRGPCTEAATAPRPAGCASLNSKHTTYDCRKPCGGLRRSSRLNHRRYAPPRHAAGSPAAGWVGR